MKKFRDLKIFLAALICLVCASITSCGNKSSKHSEESGNENVTAITEEGSENQGETTPEDGMAVPESLEAEEQEPATTAENVSSPRAAVNVSKEYPLGVQALLMSYPDEIKGFENGNLVFADGSTLLYDDGKEKDFEYMLDNSTPADMFYTSYPDKKGTPEYLADAGRSRSEPLFKKMYGSSSSAVSSKLVSVPWFGGSVRFIDRNGAADQLKKVKAEFDKHPDLHKYLKSSGTFYWRNVRGANRLSAHSYGIAIDVGVDKSDYWLWKNPGASETAKISYHNRFPMEVVEIFEKNGFIWGGAWYHFDTMHFEYRPEILAYRDLLKQQNN